MLSTTIELRRMVVAMYEEQFSKRLTELRTQKGASQSGRIPAIFVQSKVVLPFRRWQISFTSANISTLLHKNFLISARKPPME